MCNYHVWFKDEKAGYVVECGHCNRIQLCFGNILINFKPNDFKNFCDYITDMQVQKRNCEERHTKSVVLATPCVGISFILTPNELDGLCRMTDYADTEMKTAAMIKMFTEEF